MAVGPARNTGLMTWLRPAGAGRSRYWSFILPAVIVVGAVIAFPWVFTVWVSLHEWPLGGAGTFTGLQNYVRLAFDARFGASVVTTIYLTALCAILPVILGTAAALVFHEKFPLRTFFRSIYILPMMATPIAIAMVWVMMFHPQLGVLNYLLSLVGLPPSLWVYSQTTVIPSLVLVEVWQWTPLVTLIVLGGLSALPTDPIESAMIDGASAFQRLRYITLPMLMPHIMVALMLRTIDALKTFDIIFAISQGGPGTASETINLYLYVQGFNFYNLGYASALSVVFFAIVLAAALVLLWLRQRTIWTLA